MVFVAFGTKIAKREERARNPLGFLEQPLTGYAMNYTRCCTTLFFQAIVFFQGFNK